MTTEKQEKPLVRVEEDAMSLDAMTHQIQLIQQIMENVMQKDEHYGIIPGTDKPTLLKPGAEKLCLTFRFDPDYEIIREVRDEKFIAYTIKCTLFHITTGNKVASGIGSCNSREEKYRWRYEWESTGKAVPQDYWKHRDKTLLGGKGFGTLKVDGKWMIAKKGEREENLNPWDLDNTLIKMACKRALVAATLNATAASDIFTQDLEDDETLEGEPAKSKQPEKKEKTDPPTKQEPKTGAGETTVEKEQLIALAQICDETHLQLFEKFLINCRIADPDLSQKKAATMIRYWNDEIGKRADLCKTNKKEYYAYIDKYVKKLIAEYPTEYKEFIQEE